MHNSEFLLLILQTQEEPNLEGVLEKKFSKAHLGFCRRFRWIYTSDKFIRRKLRANILAAVFLICTIPIFQPFKIHLQSFMQKYVYFGKV